MTKNKTPDFDMLAQILTENRHRSVSDNNIEQLVNKFRKNDLKYNKLMASQRMSYEQMNKRFGL